MDSDEGIKLYVSIGVSHKPQKYDLVRGIMDPTLILREESDSLGFCKTRSFVDSENVILEISIDAVRVYWISHELGGTGNVSRTNSTLLGKSSGKSMIRNG
jgi:hypothetical protein